MQSPIYWHPFLYQAAMKLSYKDRFENRYKALAMHIPDKSEVLELCMGDAYLYSSYLRAKQVDYACADLNPVFVRHAKNMGLRASLLDISKDPLPSAEIILLQGSLYHFIPDEGRMIRRMLEACRSKVIISESIENLSNNGNPVKSMLGAFLSKAGSGQSKVKFTAGMLKASLAPFEKHIEVWEELPGNREIIVVLKK